jgi:diacylglycerol O-acyltransferase
VEQLGGLDAAFIYAETAGAAHVTFFAIYDPSTAPGGPVTFDDFRAHIGSRLGADRHFRLVLARVPFDLDHPYWVRDENFELSRHLHHLTLPSPGGWRQLCETVSQLHAARMDLRRPLWEAYFIDGLGAVQGVRDGAFAVCFKMHHSAVDGVSSLGIVNALHDLTPDTAPAPPDDWTPEPRPSSLNLLTRTVVTYARRPAHLVSAARHSRPLLTRLPAAMHRLMPIGHRVEHGLLGDAPHTPFNQPMDSSRNFDGRTYNLAAVKAACVLVPGATVNDVVLAAIGGAIRRYLMEKGELPESPVLSAMAITEHIGTDPRANQIAVVRVSLGTHIADPVARLRAVHRSSARSKALNEELGPRALVEYAEFVPGWLLVPAIRLGMATHLGKYLNSSLILNTHVTDMLGPQSPIYLLGARMIGGYALSPAANTAGLVHNVISYCGRLFLSINGCPVVLPDIEYYGDCMDAAFADLISATPAGSASPRTRHTRP